MSPITPAGGSVRQTSTPEASTERGTTSPAPSALRATSCQEVSPGAPVSVRGWARYTPAPGRVITSPSAASWARGPGDGDRADPVAVHEGPAGRQLSTHRVAVQLRPQGFCQFRDTATLVHDSTE
ncbi:hypothetical protein GCM10020254_66260 [Streptomyces goshikiensis]